jgi:hypothetical protein
VCVYGLLWSGRGWLGGNEIAASWERWNVTKEQTSNNNNKNNKQIVEKKTTLSQTLKFCKSELETRNYMYVECNIMIVPY